MKNNENDNNLNYYLWGGVAVVMLLILNYMDFQEHTSSNTEVINNYSLRDEDLNNIRIPAVAGLFYPADIYQLSNAVDGYLSQAGTGGISRPRIVVVPHAGYKYSAQIAAGAYKKLLPFQKDIKKIILVGPSHYVAFKGVALSNAKSFKTVFGDIPTDAEITHMLTGFDGFSYNNEAHRKEHSLEVQLPFLQKIFQDFTIVPLVYGEVNPQKIADALKPFINRPDVLIVISADLSHYLDYDSAKAVDAATAEKVSRKDPLEAHRSCGAIGINAAIALAKENNLRPKLIDIANSGDISGERDSVVGYASWIFDGQENSADKKQSPLEQEVENLKNFARHHGEEMYQVAVQSLEKAVENKKYRPSRQDYADVLFNKGASFVTLEKNGNLRGCIGSLFPREAVLLDIAENTYKAAREDSRFEPLRAEEIPQIEITISLLSGYEEMSYQDEEDLRRQLQPGVDGLVIRDGDRQGLFLPSVWKQLPTPEEFLDNLKIKAGLSPSYWSNNIKVYRFRVVEIKKNAN